MSGSILWLPEMEVCDKIIVGQLSSRGKLLEIGRLSRGEGLRLPGATENLMSLDFGVCFAGTDLLLCGRRGSGQGAGRILPGVTRDGLKN